jgi:hypothetical protein
LLRNLLSRPIVFSLSSVTQAAAPRCSGNL